MAMRQSRRITLLRLRKQKLISPPALVIFIITQVLWRPSMTEATSVAIPPFTTGDRIQDHVRLLKHTLDNAHERCLKIF